MKMKPRVVVSRCLGFEACRWDGGIVESRQVEEIGSRVEYVTVCPEVGIGLGVPRDPINLIEAGGEIRAIQPSTGRDLTEELRSFSTEFLETVSDVDGFILKSRSPSCGLEDTKIHSESGEVRGCGSGLFAEAVMDRHPSKAVVSETDLEDPEKLGEFLEKIGYGARGRSSLSSVLP